MPIEYAFRFPLSDGLHARPASLIQQAACKFPTSVTWENRRVGTRANAKSVLELMASETRHWDPCAVTADGECAQEAVAALRSLIEKDFPSMAQPAELPSSEAEKTAHLPRWLVLPGVDLRRGAGVSGGIGMGRAWSPSEIRRSPAGPELERPSDRTGELGRLRNALALLCAELDEKVGCARDPVSRDVLKAHRCMVSDAAFTGAVRKLIELEGRSAGAAVRESAAIYAEKLAASASRYLADRALDVYDVADRLLEHLEGKHPEVVAVPRWSAPTVVVARKLAPSALLEMDRTLLSGLVLAEEGGTSHTVLLARAFGIPCVAAIKGPPFAPVPGTPLLVDGFRGIVASHPPQALTGSYSIEKAARAERGERLRSAAGAHSHTVDGVCLEVCANLSSPEEAEPAFSGGADGVGLFRTEMLFMGREAPPPEDFQCDAYSRTARAAKGRPVVVRLLDAGGDKPVPYLRLPPEANPFLGKRAVRFYDDFRPMIKAQVRAVLRAAVEGDVRVMVPMVGRPAEVRLVRDMGRDASDELVRDGVPHRAGIPVGVMVEVPAAAFVMDQLAEVSDFFSVGTNDLAQYAAAADRGNPATAHLAHPLEPSFLRLLRHISSEAHRVGKRLGMCGDMAAHPEWLPLLVGLGLDEISVPPAVIPEIKAALRGLDSSECARLLALAADARCPAEVADLVAGMPPPPRAGRGDVGPAYPGLVALDTCDATKGEVIHRLAALLLREGGVDDPDAVEEAVWAREDVHPTAVGFGFAIPHCRSAAVLKTSVAFLRTKAPIPWGDEVGGDVSAVLLIAVEGRGAADAHLRIIARLSRRLAHDGFRRALLESADAGGACSAISGALAGDA